MTTEQTKRDINITGPLTAQGFQKTLSISSIEKSISEGMMSGMPETRDGAMKAQQRLQMALNAIDEELKTCRNILRNSKPDMIKRQKRNKAQKANKHKPAQVKPGIPKGQPSQVKKVTNISSATKPVAAKSKNPASKKTAVKKVAAKKATAAKSPKKTEEATA